MKIIKRFITPYSAFKKLGPAVISSVLCLGSATQASAQLDCEFQIDNQWETGAIAGIVVTNVGSEPQSLKNIVSEFEPGISVLNAWNGSVEGANPYSFSGPAWKENLLSGESHTIGMQLSGSANLDLTPNLSGACGEEITEENLPPVVNSISCTETFLHGDSQIPGLYVQIPLYNCTVDATDPNGDALTIAPNDMGDAEVTIYGNGFSVIESGTYTITYSVSDGEFTVYASSEIAATGIGHPPVPDFSCEIDNATLTASCDSSATTDPDGDTVARGWIFGGVINNANPEFTFNKPGIYDITLQVSDTSYLKQKTISVSVGNANLPPVAAFTSTDDLCNGPRLILDASTSVDPNGDALTYYWDFDDGTYEETNEPITYHGYTLAYGSTVNITLTVTDAEGSTHTVTQQATVPYPVPMATPPPMPSYDIALNVEQGPAPLSVTATIINVLFEQAPWWDSVLWTIDGEQSHQTAMSLTHTFTTVGTHTIQSKVAYVYNEFCNRSVSTTATATVEVLPEQQTEGGTCEYVVASDWGTGFTGEIRLTNNGDTAINGWEAEWVYGDGTEISNSWSGVIDGNDPYYAHGEGWNNVIQPGASVSFGFQGINGGGIAKIPELNCSFE